jgi:hypothetical protein
MTQFSLTQISACSAYSLTHKMEAIYSSETPVNIYQTTQNHILEDSTVYNMLSFVNFLVLISKKYEISNQTMF